MERFGSKFCSRLTSRPSQRHRKVYCFFKYRPRLSCSSEQQEHKSRQSITLFYFPRKKNSRFINTQLLLLPFTQFSFVLLCRPTFVLYQAKFSRKVKSSKSAIYGIMASRMRQVDYLKRGVNIFFVNELE